MQRRTVLKTSLGAAIATILATRASAQNLDDTSQASLDVVMGFMGAMGSGDMDTLVSLMDDDMIWHNEGDSRLPWIGPWRGKDEILSFLGVFGQNLQTTKWQNEDVLASGDTVAVFGVMNGVTTISGKEIGDFTFAMRAKVKDGKLVLWNWLEDSFAVSQAYNG